jgi:hypothetical protein
LLADLGVRWIRTDLPWQVTEPEKGKYNFEPWDTLLSKTKPYNLRAIAVMAYTNPHYEDGKSPATDASREAFAKWFVATAHHFRGRGILWEMYNEPNSDRFWTPKKDVQQYIQLALAVGKAMRKAEPKEMIIGPGVSGIDVPYLEECFKAGLLEYWSAVSVHPYRHRGPEAVAIEYARLRKLIDQYAPKGKKIPILAAEWGYTNAWQGIDEAAQANLLTRMMLINLANDIPLTIWYDWNDDGTNVHEQEENFGLMHHDYAEKQTPVLQPKPSAAALKTLVQVLKGYKFKERIAMESEADYVFAFSKDNTVRWIAWTTSTIPHSIVIPLKPGKYKTLSNVGKPLQVVEVDEKGFSLEVSESPIYVATDPKK